MTFRRWNCWYDRSQTFYRFRDHHTEINKHYWALIPAASFVGYLARRAPAGTTPATLFHATGPDVRRLAPDIAGWRREFGDFENWVRLSMLVSALSYLEIYINTIITMALRSDPLLRYGQTRVVDGTTWLKNDVKDSVKELVNPCIIGEWSQRLSSFRKLFGACPSELQSLESNLEISRNIRNGVAHSFGRSPDYFEDPAAPLGIAERLSEARLLEFLGTIERAAIIIDEYIVPRHIGSFELIWHYHRWRMLPRAEQEPRYPDWIGFSRNVVRTYGTGPGRSYFRALLHFYDAT